MRAVLLIVLGCGLAAAAPPPPPEHPALAPTRDVAVTYTVLTPGAEPSHVRIVTRSGGTAQRVEMGGEGAYMLVDRRGQHMAMVDPAEKMVLELPWQRAPQPFVLTDRMKFTKHGTETVAGLKCTVWDLQAPGTAGTVCVTNDGVLLRAETGDPARGPTQRSRLDATAVAFATRPDADFVPPPGFDHMVPKDKP